MNLDIAARTGQRQQQHWQLVAAAALGLCIWLYIGLAMEWPSAYRGGWFLIGDPLVALGCITMLVWRRRYPWTVALAVAVVSTVSTLATGAGLLALASISTHRRPLRIVTVALSYVVASHFFMGFYPVESFPSLLTLFYELTVPTLAAGIAVAVGVAAGARRVEVSMLRERAASAEREQDARAAHAWVLERSRIAYEMHDVLTHLISAIARQGKMLGHRENLPADENRMVVRSIADGSHQALEELRNILGALRADTRHMESVSQPFLQRIPDLVAEARASGLDIALTTAVSGTPPETVGRAAYWIVQEGLINAAAHLPSTHTHITLKGTAGCQLDVTVSSKALVPVQDTMRTTPSPSPVRAPLDLAERVDLVGGSLSYHLTPEGGCILTAQLPWPIFTCETPGV